MSEFDAGALEHGVELGELKGLDDIKINEFVDEFKAQMDLIGLDGDNFSLNENKEMVGPNNKVIDGDKVKKAINNGDLRTAYKEMGVSDNILDQKKVKGYIDSYKLGWENSSVRISIQDADDMKNSTDNIRDNNISDEPNEKEFENVIKENKGGLWDQIKSEFGVKVDDAKKEGKEEVETGSKKSWFKNTVKIITILTILGAETAGIIMLYKLIKHHQDALSGCWLLKENGDKCKVEILTCDSDARGEGDICPPINECGDTGKTACFGSKTCVDFDTKKNVCKTYLGQCTSGMCNKYCSCDKILCPKGAKLYCRKANFWEAAGDLIGKPLEWAGGQVSSVFNTLQNVLKWLMIGVAVIIGLMFLLWILKKVFKGGKRSGEKEEGKGSSENKKENEGDKIELGLYVKPRGKSRGKK